MQPHGPPGLGSGGGLSAWRGKGSDPIGTRYIMSIIYIIVFLLEKQQEVHMELWLNAGVSHDLLHLGQIHRIGEERGAGLTGGLGG